MQGVFMVVAAGNDGPDTCNVLPAATKFVWGLAWNIHVFHTCMMVTNRTAVGAIDEFDQFAYFSNYGKCVGIQVRWAFRVFVIDLGFV